MKARIVKWDPVAYYECKKFFDSKDKHVMKEKPEKNKAGKKNNKKQKITNQDFNVEKTGIGVGGIIECEVIQEGPSMTN